jgi:glyoxylase-like metal-dependent hydrolase (beta-lactamase superfamily II)
VARTPVHCLDLKFQGQPQAVAAYMLEHSGGVVLVESGPGSTVPALEAALAAHGYGIRHITHVLLTHIHLDHAGASGYLARQGAQIFVHPVGAPHLLNPEKLIASATRIYGDLMDSLWGEILPVLPEKLTILQDHEEVVVGDLHFTALNTPGHAEHHYAYQFEDLCLSGDVGAVRIPGYSYLRVPMPPPEFHLEKWRESLARLQSVGFKRIALTHFGIFDDVDWHLKATLKALDDVEAWLLAEMPADPPLDVLKQRFVAAMDAQSRALGLSDDAIEAYRLANPLSMSVDGLVRYWKKYRAGVTGGNHA